MVFFKKTAQGSWYVEYTVSRYRDRVPLTSRVDMRVRMSASARNTCRGVPRTGLG